MVSHGRAGRDHGRTGTHDSVLDSGDLVDTRLAARRGLSRSEIRGRRHGRRSSGNNDWGGGDAGAAAMFQTKLAVAHFDLRRCVRIVSRSRIVSSAGDCNVRDHRVLLGAPVNVVVLYLLLLKATLTSFSGLASLPMIRSDFVVHYHLLTDRQLNTAVAACRLGPGPLGIYVVSVATWWRVFRALAPVG